MATMTCMNISCGTTSCTQWKTGWKLRSGEFANLCDKCGYAYEQGIFCEAFHQDDSGWRNCVTCGKRLHCGCIVSVSQMEVLVSGGVKCIVCANANANDTDTFPGWIAGGNNLIGGTTQPPSMLASCGAPNPNLGTLPLSCVGRPPVVRRGRKRYMPRITEEELQEISGNSNCTIIPLFEKVLSASDVGRGGRLILPIVCAEEYFPPVSQPEGFPLTIEDTRGKEWTFQFRFWPNNESRMYVLEGVASFMKSMQLQASDTVMFSRKEPEGKLMIGFRKSSSSSLQPMEGTMETRANTLSRQLDHDGGNVNLHNNENIGERTEEGLLPVPMMMPERKKKGPKKRRLRIDGEDLEEFGMTLKDWQRQAMLRPPQNAKPSIVVDKDIEYEEYEEPPVSGKDSAVAACSSGVRKQWVQCVSCSKWRTIPADSRPSPEWKCADNVWDPSRCSCSSPEDPRELDNIRIVCKAVETEAASRQKSLDIQGRRRSKRLMKG